MARFSRMRCSCAPSGGCSSGTGTSCPLFEESQIRIEDPQMVATSGRTHHAYVTFNGRSDSRVSGMVLEITDAAMISLVLEMAYRVKVRGPAHVHRRRSAR